LKAVTGFDILKSRYYVCFKQEVVNSSDFPVNQPINFIFFVNSAKPSSPLTSSMSVVYEVTVSEPITANITASTTIVDID
jgi:hypothetical protein